MVLMNKVCNNDTVIMIYIHEMAKKKIMYVDKNANNIA